MRSLLARCVVALSVATSIGCGDDAAPVDAGTDAGVTDASGADASAPPLPLPPELPRLTPCPPGWREVVDTATPDVAHCEAWPETGVPTCADDEIFFPGASGCEPIGTACPADGFPEDLPAGVPAVFVRADAAAGGDGSRTAPFQTIPTAIATVTALPTIVAIAPGAYPGRLDLFPGLVLRGGCLAAELGDIYIGGDLTVENLSVHTISSSRGRVVVRDVLVHDANRAGITAYSNDVTVDHTAFRRMRTTAIDMADGTVDVRRSMVDEVAYATFIVSVGDLTVSDSAGMRLGSEVSGLSVLTASADAGEAAVRFERVAFDELYTGGFYAIDGAALTLRDVVVRTRPDVVISDVGVFGGGGAVIVLERVFLDQPTFQGVGVGEPGSTLEATDVLIRDIHLDAKTGRAHGIEIANGGGGRLTRVLVERATGYGVLVDRSTLEVADLLVRDTRPDAALQSGRALQAQLGSTVTGERVLLTDSTQVGMLASYGASITLSDVEVSSTRASMCTEPECVQGGIGAGAYTTGRIDLSRFRLAGHALTGAQVALMGELDLRDGEVSDNPVGVNVQVPGYDFDRLDQNVAFRRNGQNLDSSALPVPPPLAGGG